MKALSVRQPWASLIAIGRKTIEVRTWRTNYRGPLVICASKRPLLPGRPTGVAVCTVTLVDCRPITHGDASAACCDVDPSREFAWVLADTRPLDFLVPVSGRLGLFAPSPEVLSAVAS
ncbi:MAG: ASCH domain-containing protein [Bacteroidales bacterium]